MNKIMTQLDLFDANYLVFHSHCKEPIKCDTEDQA